MFTPDLTKAQLRNLIDDMSELDVARLLYCQEMAGTYLAVAKFEDMLISAMHMSDRVKVKKLLGADADRWTLSLAKAELLRGSTLGSLIKILERHDVIEADIHYLKWIKEKRDYFTHRFFHDGAWPGNLDEESCRLMSRRLLAIQIWLSRAERNIWLIFERAGFVVLNRFDNGNLLAMNLGISELLRGEVNEIHTNSGVDSGAGRTL
jgi:hypothetical protein